jgi:predicted amidohydrolase YtcJ
LETEAGKVPEKLKNSSGRMPIGRATAVAATLSAHRQAIAAYTIAGAFLAHEEKVRGSIEPGKVADLVVLEKNLFMVPPLEIHSVATDMTVLNGRILFERHNR